MNINRNLEFEITKMLSDELTKSINKEILGKINEFQKVIIWKKKLNKILKIK